MCKPSLVRDTKMVWCCFSCCSHGISLYLHPVITLLMLFILSLHPLWELSLSFPGPSVSFLLFIPCPFILPFILLSPPPFSLALLMSYLPCCINTRASLSNFNPHPALLHHRVSVQAREIVLDFHQNSGRRCAPLYLSKLRTAVLLNWSINVVSWWVLVRGQLEVNEWKSWNDIYMDVQCDTMKING